MLRVFGLQGSRYLPASSCICCGRTTSLRVCASAADALPPCMIALLLRAPSVSFCARPSDWACVRSPPLLVAQVFTVPLRLYVL